MIRSNRNEATIAIVLIIVLSRQTHVKGLIEVI